MSESKENTEKQDLARNAWRSLLIPAVGSAAFFSSMLTNIFKTYTKHGFPKNSFKKTDYLLMAIPFVIIPLALFDGIQGGEETGE
jgi:hypothetical protein